MQAPEKERNMPKHRGVVFALLGMVLSASALGQQPQLAVNDDIPVLRYKQAPEWPL